MEDTYFEIINHTADIGLRVFAPQIEALVWPATLGLYSLFGELEVETHSSAEKQLITLCDSDIAYLLRDYLNEVLYLFSQKKVLTALEDVKFHSGLLKFSGFSQPLDENRSVLQREIKAITYHELAIKKNDSRVVATVIVDI